MQTLISILLVVTSAALYASLVWATSSRLKFFSWVLFAVLLIGRLQGMFSNEYLDVNAFTVYHAFPFAIFSVLLANFFIGDQWGIRHRMIASAVLLLLVSPLVRILTADTGSRMFGYEITSSLDTVFFVLASCFIIWSGVRSRRFVWMFIALLVMLPVAMMIWGSSADLDNAAMGFAMLVGAMVIPLSYYFPLALAIGLLSRHLTHSRRVVLLFVALLATQLPYVSPSMPYLPLVVAHLEDKQKVNTRQTQRARTRDDGPEQLALAVERGELRVATKNDVQRWKDANEKSRLRKVARFVKGKRGYASPVVVENMHFKQVYVVLSAFDIPAGLYGAHSVEFIVEHGVEYPTGDPGHSTIFDLNSLDCRGSNCR